MAIAKPVQIPHSVVMLLNHVVDDRGLVFVSSIAEEAEKSVVELQELVVHIEASGVVFEVSNTVALCSEVSAAVRALMHIRCSFHSQLETPSRVFTAFGLAVFVHELEVPA